jgi:hypothetical protein
MIFDTSFDTRNQLKKKKKKKKQREEVNTLNTSNTNTSNEQQRFKVQTLLIQSPSCV